MEEKSFQRISAHYTELTNKQKELLDSLLGSPEDVCYITLKALSKRSGVSEVTILRMCKRLGFDSFVELKKAFREHTERLVKNNMEVTHFSLDLPQAERGDKQGLLHQIIDSAEQQSHHFFAEMPVEKVLLTAREILAAKTVLICGQGVSGIVAEYFYRRISPLVQNAILMHPEDIDNVQANLAKLRPGDHVIAISFPRYYTAMQNIALYAEHIGARITAVTDSKSSPIITKSSTNYLCETSTKVFYNNYSLPMELVNLVASGIVLEMGSGYDHLVAKAHEVIHFINEAQGS